MITKSESLLGASMAKAFVVLIIISFGIQALCVEYLVRQSKNLESRIHDVPNQIDNEVAKIALESHGIKLEELTKEQISYINSWQEGT